MNKRDLANYKYISQSAPAELITWLGAHGYVAVPVASAPNITTPIASHADIQMCRLGCRDDSPVFSAKATDLTSLGSDYPSDVPFNAACTGKYFIHNIKYTNPELLAAAKDAEMTIVDVKQGYAKCSVVVVDEDSIITYDVGLAAACEHAGLSVLLVSPGHVQLEGYNTGFIGGASGRIDGTIIFCGDITGHPDYSRIRDFIESRGLKIKYFDFPLTDIGSIV